MRLHNRVTLQFSLWLETIFAANKGPRIAVELRLYPDKHEKEKYKLEF
jgi:hypothetical protein